jgi:integrase
VSRGQGRLYRPDNGRFQCHKYWMDYTVDGKRHRESTHTTNRTRALDLLRQRIGDRKDGKLTGQPDRVTFGDLRQLVERQYTLDGLRSLTRVKQLLGHLERLLGATTRALDLTPTRQDAYAAQRLAEGVARSTVNRELAALRRGFKLALEKGLLATMPLVKLPKEHNARSGFFEPGDFAALLLELPAHLRALIRFLRLTGWRVSEAVGLTWDAVDWEGGVLRLRGSQTKSGRPRAFPFSLAPELKQLLDAQWAARDGLFVFHRQGHRIGNFRGVWLSACKRAGLDGRLVHDLRRTAARDYRRAGVSEGEIMDLCGWRTRAMFDRYNIIDEQDLATAVAKRFNSNGTPTAHLEGTAAAERRLSSGAAT